MKLRTGTNRDPCLNNHALWGCFHICSILVPFHNLRTNGGDLKRDPLTPFSVLKKENLKFEINLFWTAMLSEWLLLIRLIKILKAGVLVYVSQFNVADRAVSVFGHDDLGLTMSS